ncbi:hypothetical protein DFS33DRAFT_930133 [Desarmillaria ectypa]|nr:hypothetical protein DFS33DRAFT_930133 [Desarmillaria ectypa]
MTIPIFYQLYDAAAYITGIDHAGWRIVAQYYINYFKTGAAPATTEDQVVLWYRIHPREATCSGGTQPYMYDFPADAVFALAMLAENGAVAVNIGKHRQHQPYRVHRYRRSACHGGRIFPT